MPFRFTKETSKTASSFWKRYDQLPPWLQRIARQKYQLFLESPQSVEFKQLKSLNNPPVFSARVTDDYRAVGYLVEDKIVWI